MTFSEALLIHLEQLSPARAVCVMEVNHQVSVQVLRFDAGDGVAVFATFGLTLVPWLTGGPIELLSGWDDSPDDELGFLLARATADSIRSGAKFAPGSTVSAVGDVPVPRDFYISPLQGFSDAFAFPTIEDRSVRLLHALPLLEGERSLIARHGGDWFETMLQLGNADPWDRKRPGVRGADRGECRPTDCAAQPVAAHPGWEAVVPDSAGGVVATYVDERSGKDPQKKVASSWLRRWLGGGE